MHSVEFEEFFRKHDAVFLLTDADTGQLLDANEAALDFYGYTLPQIQSMKMADIRHLSPDELDAERTRAAVEGRTYVVESHRVASGDTRTVEVHVAPVLLGGERRLFSVVHDVTELGRVREALQAESQALADAEHVAEMGSWHWDIASNEITWSDELCRLNGHDPALPTPTYEEHLKMYTPESAERLNAAVRAATEWVPYELDLELVRPDGTHWFGAARGEPVLGPHGEVVGLRGTLTDITERVRAEEALRESEDMFEWVFSGSAVPRSITSTTGEARLNDAFREMLGYTRDELPDGIAWLGLTHPDDVAETQRQMDMLISGEQLSARYEKRYLRKDGGVVWADVHSSLRRGADGRSLYFGTAMVDITDRKQVEEALREREEKYRSLFSNAQIGMFRTRLDGSEMLDANDKLLEILGRTRDEVVGKPSVLHWADPRERDEMARKLEAEGRVTDFECRMLDKRGGVRVCVTSLRLYPETGILEGSIADVTERKEAERQHDALLRSAMDGFFVVDTEGRLLEVNEAYREMSGYSEQELLAMRVQDLDAVEAAEDVAARMRRIIAQGQDRFESQHRRKDGTVFDVENSISYQPESGRFAAFVRDITRRKQREEYGWLSREVLVMLNEPGDPRDSVQRIVRVVKDRTGFDAVGIRLQEGEDFPYFASKGFPEGHFLTENTLISRDEAGGACRNEDGDVALEGTCGLVLSGGDDPLLSPGGSFWTSDLSPMRYLEPDGDPRLHPRNLCILEGFASVALVPIKDRKRIVGLIHLADRRMDRLDGETVQLLEGIAIHIGEAMTRKHDEERLARTLTSVIDIARDIVEERDPYTAGHQLRVCEIAVRVAQDLGMSDSDVEDIRIAALIHDVGKVVVPTEILSKPGTISRTEYELLKAHAEAGHRILVGSHMEEPVPELVYQHHERCDGSGYPRALTGDQMLMGAKVIAVADVVEAMTSHRPYRPALGLGAALAEVERGAGRLYDADVARACIALFREQHFELSALPA